MRKNDISLYANYRARQRRTRRADVWTHLLSETDARTGVEGEEDERVWGEVLVNTVIQEPVGIVLLGYT